MGIGNFRHKAVFRTRDESLDEFGQPTTEYNELMTVGARITQLSGNERQQFTTGVAITEDYISITTRWSNILDTIDKSAEVLISGRNYSLVGISRLDERRQYIRFVLREIR